MSVREDRKYTSEHEWAKLEGDLVRIGITDYAQKELGDVVFIDLPEVGSSLSRGASFSSVESVKAVSDIYAPIDGEVVQINEELTGSPDLINLSPYDKGWIVVIRPANRAQYDGMMEPAAYTSHVQEISK